MAEEIYYEVRVKIVNRLSKDQYDFIEINNEFKDNEPIIAREQAFKRYQSYLDVILKKDNISDLEARLKLKSYSDIDLADQFDTNNSNSLSNGIGVFCIVRSLDPKDEQHPFSFFNLYPKDELFIHGIGEISFRSFDPNSICYSLEREYNYYQSNGFKTNQNETKISFCDKYEWEEGYLGNGKWVDESYIEPHDCIILKTPFDWSGYDKPYWWKSSIDDNEESVTNNINAEKIKELIVAGENNQVEFKPSLLYNFSTRKPGKSIKGIIAKTIAAFLNSNGGFLIIGVSDNGQIQGLSYDFKLSDNKNPKDFFLLQFDNMLDHFFSFSVKPNVYGQFINIDDKDIFIVNVSPSKSRPIFLNGQYSKEFYVRGEASTRRLSDIEHIINYCIERFKK
ncbi:MAG: hypothetical protein Kow00127_15200 [Bacteroidales bacterium]